MMFAPLAGAGMSDPKRLYDADFVLWAQQQAAALRAAAQGGSNLQLDWENLGEEIEGLGISQRSALRSQIRRIIRHLVKLEHSPAREPRRGWEESISDARAEIEDLLETSPSLAVELDRDIAAQARRAIERAIGDLQRHGEAGGLDLSRIRSTAYGREQILGDWFPPEPREQGGAA
jgi:hypothetical protein